MSKQSFINTVKELDDWYIPTGYNEKYIKEDIKKYNCKTLKEYFTKRKYKYGLSNVDVKTINELTLDDNKTKNPFIIFYELDELSIKKLFYLLSKMENALRCYYKYAEPKKDLKKKNSHGGIKKDIQKIMAHIENTDIEVAEHISSKINLEKVDYDKIPQGYKAYEYLQWMINSLDNIHYTKKQLFQNLLYEMNEILVPKKISRMKIYNSTNLLIKHYFGICDISFTTKQKINNFITIDYQYEGTITLTHSNNNAYKKMFS